MSDRGQRAGAPATPRCQFLWLVFGALLGAPLATSAQQPDAGSTLRDLERPAIELPRRLPPDIQIEQPVQPALKPGPDVRFNLKAFRVTGNTVFAESELLAPVAGLVGRDVGFSDLEEAAARVTRFYRESGYTVARAYLPAQDIRNGVVEIAVLEGRFGKVGIQNRSRVRDGVILAYLEPLQGRLVEERSFERKLLLLYELPGIGDPRASLKPGAKVGESDLALELDPGPAATGSIELDNYGNRFTGANRYTAQANALSPTRSGDLLTLRTTRGDPGLEYGRIAYQLPLGGDGLRVGAGYSRTDYRLGRDFSALEANGSATSASGFASYPFVRSRAFNLYGQAGYERRDLEDRVDATATVTDKNVNVVTFTLSGDSRDDVGGGGVSVFSLTYASGNLDIETPSAKALDEASARTDGGYNKWSLSLLRNQRLNERFSLYVSATGQKAGKNLDSSEKFVLGGANGVRAYPQGEASGDTGYVFSAELRYAFAAAPLPGTLQLAGFVDTGEITINENPFAAGDNRRRLSGGGAGLTWFGPGNLQSRLMIARKIGDAAATSGTNRDTRVWMEAIKYF